MSESKLEAELYESMRLLSMTEQGFPMPERELHPFWCCEHTRGEHRWTEWDSTDGSSFECWWCHGCPSNHWMWQAPNPARHEYRRDRNWRCDFVWPDLRLIVEVEGGVYSGGRHTRPSGFVKDIEKYNALTEDGWKVLRFSRREVKSGEALNVIERVLREEGSRP